MTLVFVYGTLKRGLSNHGFLAGQSLAGEAQTQPGFELYALDGFPGMVAAADGAGVVTGEVWSVDDACLAQLDELEGTAEGLYCREAVPLGPPFAGTRVEAYLYLKGVEGRPRLGSTWPG
jgi:gamma-glutamylaminecyclotransferase